MNKKKIKKLINNPKQFFHDSKFFKKISTAESKNNKEKNSLGFIILNDNPSHFFETINSITNSSKAHRKNIRTIQIDGANSEKNIINLIQEMARELKCDYIKVMHAGDLVNAGFIQRFSTELNLQEEHEIIAHTYSHNLNQSQPDAFLTHNKARLSKSKKTEKDFIFPYFGSVIVKSEILNNLNEFIYSKNFHINTVNLLSIIEKEGGNLRIFWDDKLISSNIEGLRIESRLQELVKNPTDIISFLTHVDAKLSGNSNHVQLKRSTLSFIHGIVTVLLKNKKSDELLNDHEKNSVLTLLTSIISNIGTDVLNNFSSSNYNHVHKIGYLNILKEAVPGDLCYVEDVQDEEKLIKFKIATSVDYIPSVILNDKEATPISIKIKPLTLFSHELSYEIFIWVDYQSHQKPIRLISKSGIDFIVNGKRRKTCKAGELIKSFKNKKSISPTLPFKAKILRYLSTRPIIKKKFSDAWVFIDNELRADDNAEHFYRYVSSQHKSEKCFFLIDKKSKDWDRLRKDGVKLIRFGGFWHRVALINAKYLLSSHANPAIVNFLPKKHFSDIMNFKFVFLQHGITKDDQSEWLNSRKIDCLVTAGVDEYNDIAGRGRYRFTSKEVVLTGFPRYDNLYTQEKKCKKILIMPTWRKSLSGELIKKSSKRIKNENFADSAFANMWGGFLRSKDLELLVKSFGYTIEFYPHPNLIDYIEDLNIPEYIGIGDITTYSIQDVFRKSDILITDYSSVAFDIAYMKKPIIYFHFDIETFFSEHSYSKGYFDYNTHGFGPVCESIDDLIKNLNYLIKNECEISIIYKERIDSFFPYQDRNNSSRLYHHISELNNNGPDSLTLIEKLENLVKHYEIQSACDFLKTYRSNIASVPSALYIRASQTLSILYFWCAANGLNDDKQIINSVMKEIDNPSSNIDFHNYIDAIFSNINTMTSSNDDSVFQKTYFESTLTSVEENENAKNITKGIISHPIINIINMMEDFKSDKYNEVIDKANEIIGEYSLYKSRNISLIILTSLIRTQNIDEAILWLNKIEFNLYLTEKEFLLLELSKAASPDNIYNLSIQCLYPESSTNNAAIESFFKFCNTVSKNQLLDLPIQEVESEHCLFRYLDYLYSAKDFSDFLHALDNNKNKYDYLNHADRAEKFLKSVMEIDGTERFIKELNSLFNPENFSEKLTHIILNTKVIDHKNACSIIKKVLHHDCNLLESIDIYKLALNFHKNARPSLAKEISAQYVISLHEKHYSSPENWLAKNDYKTLMNAISELNDVAHELNRLSVQH